MQSLNVFGVIETRPARGSSPRTSCPIASAFSRARATGAVPCAYRDRIHAEGDALMYEDHGRVAMPFGFALTDPGGRISRTRLFPRVTRVISEPAPKFE